MQQRVSAVQQRVSAMQQRVSAVQQRASAMQQRVSRRAPARLGRATAAPRVKILPFFLFLFEP
jgi:hypothetical protein